MEIEMTWKLNFYRNWFGKAVISIYTSFIRCQEAGNSTKDIDLIIICYLLCDNNKTKRNVGTNVTTEVTCKYTMLKKQ